MTDNAVLDLSHLEEVLHELTNLNIDDAGRCHNLLEKYGFVMDEKLSGMHIQIFTRFDLQGCFQYSDTYGILALTTRNGYHRIFNDGICPRDDRDSLIAMAQVLNNGLVEVEDA